MEVFNRILWTVLPNLVSLESKFCGFEQFLAVQHKFVQALPEQLQ